MRPLIVIPLSVVQSWVDRYHGGETLNEVIASSGHSSKLVRNRMERAGCQFRGQGGITLVKPQNQIQAQVASHPDIRNDNFIKEPSMAQRMAGR